MSLCGAKIFQCVSRKSGRIHSRVIAAGSNGLNVRKIEYYGTFVTVDHFLMTEHKNK